MIDHWISLSGECSSPDTAVVTVFPNTLQEIGVCPFSYEPLDGSELEYGTVRRDATLIQRPRSFKKAIADWRPTQLMNTNVAFMPAKTLGGRYDFYESDGLHGESESWVHNKLNIKFFKKTKNWLEKLLWP